MEATNQEDYIFRIGSGLGEIRFSMNEKQVTDLLGEPDEIENESSVDEEDGTQEEVKYLNYHELGVRVALYFYDGQFESLNIFTDKVLLRGTDLFEADQKEILDIIKKIYQEEEWEFKYDYEFYEEDDDENSEEEYNFDRIGLTLWFQSESLDEACMYQPLNED